MRYYVIAGEASGDLHASNLMKELNLLDHNADFRCWGGDLMKAQGGVLVKHFKDLAFMGFIEVVANLRTILRNMSFCKKDILEYKPDVLILVDYPGFNLPIAKFAKKAGIKVFYYISPQIWAWKQSRVHAIKRDVDRMFVILPFEKDFYQRFQVDVDYVGHPLLDAIGSKPIEKPLLADNNNKPIVALLPGSRKQEISKLLPEMIALTDIFKDYKFVIAAAPSIPDSFYKKIINGKDVEIIKGQTYQLLKHSRAALVTSGTATLETALLGTPEAICYKGSAISVAIARRIIKVKYISLVNLIMDKLVVKELIQKDCNTVDLTKELRLLLEDENYRSTINNNYKELTNILGAGGASARTAQLMYQHLSSHSENK